jgi:hypothetical protein
MVGGATIVHFRAVHRFVTGCDLGCLTCRVRRKKCTGMPEGGGACESCQRLCIECLGYSAKRPAWMQVGGVSKLFPHSYSHISKQNAEQLAECRREIRLWLAERGKGPRAVGKCKNIPRECDK